MTTSGKTPICGPERWTTKDRMACSYWDLWFCVAALVDHDGDLDALAEALEEGGRLSGGGTAEAKLSHLEDLKRRMAAAGIDAETLVAGETWCEDLCELLAWENWGLLLHAETRPFAQLRGELAEHAERFMLALADELRAHRLRYEADQTL